MYFLNVFIEILILIWVQHCEYHLFGGNENVDAYAEVCVIWQSQMVTALYTLN